MKRCGRTGGLGYTDRINRIFIFHCTYYDPIEAGEVMVASSRTNFAGYGMEEPALFLPSAGPGTVLAIPNNRGSSDPRATIARCTRNVLGTVGPEPALER